MKIGQKVLCIDDSPGRIDGRKFLEKNVVYTVKTIYPEGGYKLLEDPFYDTPIRLNGKLNDLYWDAKRFKSLKYENISAELIGKIVEEKSEILISH